VNVFVDASAFIAHLNRRDARHQEAHAIFAELRQQQATLVTCTWTAYEALSIVKARVGAGAAKALWGWLSDPENVALVSVAPEIERTALDLFLTYEDKTWGIVDCASFVVMGQLDCKHAFAFDRHFVEASRQHGFQNLSAQ
jgi:uncharacterized protein